MKAIRKRIRLTILIMAAGIYSSHAQHPFKAGLGINYISNTFKESNLADYFAVSGNLSYTFLSARLFGLSIENATSIRSKSAKDELDNNSKLGFTSSLPVVASLHLTKMSLYAGAGPAYVKQTAETNRYSEKASGVYLNNLVGVGFTGKAIIPGVLYPEYNIRFSYLKSLRKPAYDGGMISFLVFLKG